MILHYWVIISKPYYSVFGFKFLFLVNELSLCLLTDLSVDHFLPLQHQQPFPDPRFVDIQKKYSHKGVLYCYLFPCREVKNANADMRAKIQKLVEVGLLGFAHWSKCRQCNPYHDRVDIWTEKLKLYGSCITSKALYNLLYHNDC